MRVSGYVDESADGAEHVCREGVDGLGKFYDLVQQHIDAQEYPPSEREVARKLDVTPSTLANWRNPKQLIAKRHIIAVSELAGVRYERARDALLEDIGYLTEADGPSQRGQRPA